MIKYILAFLAGVAVHGIYAVLNPEPAILLYSKHRDTGYGGSLHHIQSRIGIAILEEDDVDSVTEWRTNYKLAEMIIKDTSTVKMYPIEGSVRHVKKSEAQSYW